MKQKLTIAQATVLELEIIVQRLVPDNHFGGWLRTPSMRHISHFNYVPTAKSKFRNKRNPIVLQAILVGDLHALLPAMVLSLSDSPTPLFFFFVERWGLHYEGDGKSAIYFFFFGRVWRGGDRRCTVPFDEALRRSNAVLLGYGPEDRGRGIRKL